MAHSYTCLLYHLVFSTKDREPWLQAELRPGLWEYLSGAIRSEGGFCLIANGVSDHVHLLARLRQDKAISEVLRSIKANSSGWIHDAFPKLRGFHWQEGYGAFTVSKSQIGSGTSLYCGTGSSPPEGHVSRRIPGTPEGARD